MGVAALNEAMQAVLRMLSQADFRDRLVLRGGLVTARYVHPEPRPAEDVDLLDPGERFEPDRLEAWVRALLPNDAPVTSEVIWAETDNPGLRVQQIQGEVTLQVDVGYGDPLVDGPVPLELAPGVEVLACRPETLVGWKLHGLFERGGGQWRPKDLHDLDLLFRRAELDPARVRRAIAVAFDSRGDDLALAERLLAGTFGTSRWSAHKWRRFTESRAPYDPGPLAEAVARVSAALGKVLT